MQKRLAAEAVRRTILHATSGEDDLGDADDAATLQPAKKERLEARLKSACALVAERVAITVSPCCSVTPSRHMLYQSLCAACRCMTCAMRSRHSFSSSCRRRNSRFQVPPLSSDLRL